jgi:uncharacterized membrane protein YjjB (DUF3815 family)
VFGSLHHWVSPSTPFFICHERWADIESVCFRVISILGNLYSRIFGGTAFTSMVPGVLFLVPVRPAPALFSSLYSKLTSPLLLCACYVGSFQSGIAAAGGLAMTQNSGGDGDQYSQGLIIGFRMVQVAIGITVGLFGSGLFIYSFGRKKGAALFAF